MFIKRPEKKFSYGVSQCNKNSAYETSFNVSEARDWVPRYKKIWEEVELEMLEKLATEPVNSRYVHGKWKT